MCLIVDNNKRDEFFKNPLGEVEESILDWISGAGKLVVGGNLKRELLGSSKMKAFLRQLKLAGRLNEVDDNEVDRKQRDVERAAQLASDDPHVIALALVSSARLLYTSDSELIRDFKNPAIISSPRGKIFNGCPKMLRREGICSRC